MRELFKIYMKKCASAGIPEYIALGQFLKKTGSIEMGNKLIKTAGLISNVWTAMPGNNLAKTLITASALPTAKAVYDVGKWALADGDATQKEIYRMNRELVNLKKNLTPSSLAHTAFGGTIGGAIGTAYGPQIFDQLDPAAARIIGALTGSAIGGFGGHTLHNLTYNT